MGINNEVMVIRITYFKGAKHVDKFGRMYVAKTTCIIKSTPHAERYFLTNGMEVSKSTCFEKVK